MDASVTLTGTPMKLIHAGITLKDAAHRAP
jgi:hypothetical protein